jgi:pimeloyl-ACP methyl ester carboxylesterase
MNFVFLHGGGQGSWVWQETIASLNKQATDNEVNVLALDAPGCGTKRHHNSDILTLEEVAQYLIRDIEYLGLSDVVLVGHSQAGQAMTLMVEIKPELFRRLIYVSCSIPLPEQSVQQMLGTSVQGSNPNEVGWPLDPTTTTLEERYGVMFCNDMDEPQRTTFLAKLGQDQWPRATYAFTNWSFEHLGAVPSTFVLCLRDQILPPVWQEIFAQRFKTERTVRIDAGHQVMNTRPHALAEVLLHEAASSAPVASP